MSVASQSGALGIALLDEASDHGIGIRHFVSLGNEADVSAEDLLEYWESDPGTRVILLYLETIRDPRRFLETARRVTRSKPVVAVKSGRSVAGSRAAGSHTGALATKDVLVDALLSQAGVVRVSTLEELFDAATLLTTQQGPMGRRVAIVTNAGGPGVLTADACEARGLLVPPFDDRTADAIEGAVPGTYVRNPLDLLAGATAQTFDAVLPLTLGDPGIDTVIVECVPTTTTDVREVAMAIAAARRYAQKPIVACVMGKRGVDEARLDAGQGSDPDLRVARIGGGSRSRGRGPRGRGRSSTYRTTYPLREPCVLAPSPDGPGRGALARRRGNRRPPPRLWPSLPSLGRSSWTAKAPSRRPRCSVGRWR